jgi:DNA-directed RNA polymerase subunit RPC12/RpoP
MPIAVTCSSCGARLKVADRLDGRTTACPRCRTILLVRRPAPPKPAPAPPPQSAPPPADVEDLAAALLTGADGGARQAPGAALPEGVARASREAERLIRLMLDCAGKGKDQTVYLLTFDLLKEINRRAGDGSLTERKAHELWQRYVHDGGGHSFVGNFLVVGAAYVPAGSTLTLQEGYDLFRKRLL